MSGRRGGVRRVGNAIAVYIALAAMPQPGSTRRMWELTGRPSPWTSAPPCRVACADPREAARLSDDWTDVLSALSESGARFLVVGAHAMAVHGVPRGTQDLDVWIDPDVENAERVARSGGVRRTPRRAWRDARGSASPRHRHPTRTATEPHRPPHRDQRDSGFRGRMGRAGRARVRGRQVPSSAAPPWSGTSASRADGRISSIWKPWGNCPRLRERPRERIAARRSGFPSFQRPNRSPPDFRISEPHRLIRPDVLQRRWWGKGGATRHASLGARF